MRILVIEDEKKVAEFIGNGLAEEGYAVDTAHDGEQGYFLASTSEYDVILLDVMLPKIDGITLCTKLRAEDCQTPILMLTAKDAVKDKVRGLDAGADDYVTKPFAFEELLARIRSLLRKTYLHQGTRFQVDDLVLDTATHTVTRAGTVIPLSVKEYALLEYLMGNAGSVVTRAMISEHVWDINFDTFTNVIDVYISYLRNKIDKGRKTRLIHTVRGRGYVLKS
ncbi:MAG TPA: response regulator transcription factor [Deltaproteobacteria bacterium]|nr:response regulator transcription factor [Deltaproteobacteria bacterium]